jgi:DNA-entry nuclease
MIDNNFHKPYTELTIKYYYNGEFEKLMKKLLKWIPAILIVACILMPKSNNESNRVNDTIVSDTFVSDTNISNTIEVDTTQEETEPEPETSDIKEEYLYGAVTPSQFDINAIPTYTNTPYVEVNGNIPYFTDEELTTTAFENYSELDSLGRCGTAYANICKEIMPTEERGKIGEVKPTGWHLVKYDIVDGNYLYNRCHLIGYQLSGENANVQNLITGTRYLNETGMLLFEDEVAEYVKETDNHVLYRVTPIFSGNNLLADGVLMEAKSVEDNGAGIQFNVFCYNVQPGITIDYATGDSTMDDTDRTDNDSIQAPVQNVTQNTETSETKETTSATQQEQSQVTDEQSQTVSNGSYAVNAKNGKIHIVGDCPATKDGDNAMKQPVYFNTYEEAEAYSISIAPNQDKRQCGNCW